MENIEIKETTSRIHQLENSPAAEHFSNKGEVVSPPKYNVRNNQSGLPEALYNKFQQAFDIDLSDLKIKQDSKEADQMTAAAFARVNEIHFGQGIYDPNSLTGKHIIAHEIAHVVQQSQAHVPSTGRVNGKAINNDPHFERKADQSAAKAISHTSNDHDGQFTYNSRQAAGNTTAQRLTLFAHGFLKKRDFWGNKNRKKHGNILHGQDYNDYWKDLDDKFAERLGDNNMMYFDGSAGALASAKSRQKAGKQAGYNLIHHLIAERDPSQAQAKFKEVKLNEKGQSQGEKHKEPTISTNIKDKESHSKMLDDIFETGMMQEPIAIIGHSMGAAFAAGIAEALKEYEFNIKSVYYVAPHQPADIKHPEGVRGVQYSHKKDTVSSRGLVPFFSGSKLAKIPGVEYVLHDDPNLKGDWWTGGGKDAGGHYVQYHDYIFEKYGEEDNGYVEPIKELEF
jgi:hypothetical protein